MNEASNQPNIQQLQAEFLLLLPSLIELRVLHYLLSWYISFHTCIRNDWKPSKHNIKYIKKVKDKADHIMI